MPDRLARCVNRDYCTLGDSAAVLRLAVGDRFFCPECAHALEPVPDRRMPERVAAPVRLARCMNRDYCTFGDEGTVLRLESDAPAYCPECAHALMPVADRRARHVPWEAKAGMLAAVVVIALLVAYPHRRATVLPPPSTLFEVRSDPLVVELKAAILGLLPSPDGPLRRRHHLLHGPRLELAAADAGAWLLAGIPVAPGMPWHEDRAALAAGMPWRQALIMAALMTPGDPPSVPAPSAPAPVEIEKPQGAAAGGQSSSAAPASAPIQLAATNLRSDNDLTGLISLASDATDAPALVSSPPVPSATTPATMQNSTPKTEDPGPTTDLWRAKLTTPLPAPILRPIALVPPEPEEVAGPPPLAAAHVAQAGGVAEQRPTKTSRTRAAKLSALPRYRTLAPPEATEARVAYLLPPPAETVAAPPETTVTPPPSAPKGLWQITLAKPAVTTATVAIVQPQPRTTVPQDAPGLSPAPEASDRTAPHPRVVVLPATAQVSFTYGPLKDVHLPDAAVRSFFLPARPSSEKPRPGSLTVNCEIATTGVPSDCQVVSAHNAAQVTEALLGWLGSGLVHYPPKTQDGQPVRARRTITVDFPAERAP